MGDVYEPAEDSWLLEDATRLFARGWVLDMGTGSGIVAAAAAETADKVVGVDIDMDAVTAARAEHPEVEFIQSDLFAMVSGQFDLITFNPPYLPTSEEDVPERTVDGGKEGDEILLRFLTDSDRFLAPGGNILFLASSLTRMDRITKLISGMGMSMETVLDKKISFETLTVYRVWR